MDTPQKILSDRYNDMDWGESLALTLNLKQCRHVTDLDKNRTFKIWITESDIHNTVRHFVNLLNRRMFGNHWKRDGRRLEVLAVSEKSNRHHLHLRIKTPIQTANTLSELKANSQITLRLITAITECWKKLDWSYSRKRLTHANNGWTEYQFKNSTLTEVKICEGTYVPEIGL